VDVNGGETVPDIPHRPRFREIAAEAGLRLTLVNGSPTVDHIIDSLGSGAGFLDYDGDGDWDLYVAQGASRQKPEGPADRLFRNDGPEGFTDVTEAAGLGDRRWSFAVAVADYDGDGDDDLYLTNWGRNRLYRNDNGRFVDVAPAAGVDDAGFGSAAAWGDVDRDGDLDLFLVNYVDFTFDRYPARGENRTGWSAACSWRGLLTFCGPRNLQGASDRLWLNDGDPDADGVPNFRETTAVAGVAGDDSYGLAALFFDADSDGDQDLYVANDSVANGFFRNRGDGTFDSDGLISGLAYNEEGHEQAGMGVSAGDFDRDGHIDLAVTNFSHDHDTLYHNEGDGYFMDVSYPAGIGTPSFLTLGWGTRLADFDHDGFEDLFVAHGHVYPQVDGQDLGTSFAQKNELFWNKDGETFLPLGTDAGPAFAHAAASRSVATADVDGDGDLDLAITNLNGTLELWRNEAPVPPWLKVSLRSGSLNRHGIGARLTLHCGERSQTREIRRQSGYLASDAPVAHFGLPCSDSPRLEVRWPDGGRQTVDIKKTSRHLTIDRGQS
jgi:hypothetical protein